MEDYRHHGTGLLRAAAHAAEPVRWPDPDDEQDCRSWLGQVWTLPRLADAVRDASPVLAERVEAITAGKDVGGRKVRRAALSVARYALRASGRSTPFGTFAGVGPLSVGKATQVAWSEDHRPVAAADTTWLHRVIERLESCPELLELLDVVVNDMAEVRGGRWEIPGTTTVRVRWTSATEYVRDEAGSPIQFRVLADKLTNSLGEAGNPVGMLTSLVQHGFLRTSLRAPSTVTDPLGWLFDRLQEVGAAELPVAPLVDELSAIREEIRAHNRNPSAHTRVCLADRMRAVAEARTPLAITLRLDADVQIPNSVGREMCRAASVLARLVREPTGTREWREYFAAFCERYGSGTLVPLRELVDTDTGLGWPRGYPGSGQPSGRHVFSERDKFLMELAEDAAIRGSQEVELDDEILGKLAETGGGGAVIPPHVEVGARIHAVSKQALDRGDYTFTVSLGRAVGTLTGRFLPLVPEVNLEAVIRNLPTIIAGAVPVQLSFPPQTPGAENVSRIPAYLPDVLSVGEGKLNGTIDIDDLAVTATRHRLHVVSLSRRRVIEPHVLHALAAKQQPPLARMLGELSRALQAGWIGFDWGAADAMPFLPRLRYGRAILSPARWHLKQDRVPTDAMAWHRALDLWRKKWHCPPRVQLRDGGQWLPLDLDQPAHRAVLHQHMRRHRHATLTEAVDDAFDGWLDGRAHTVVLPLASRRPPIAGPPITRLPVITADHGHVPACSDSSWLCAKLYLSARRMDELIVTGLPALLRPLGDRDCWFVRYPQIREEDEPSHLRLRVRVADDAPELFATLGCWADVLRSRGLIGRLAFDTYYPERGRYVAMEQAEHLFVADSRLVLTQLALLGDETRSGVLTALNLFDIAAVFLGSRQSAADWLSDQARHEAPEREVVDEVQRLARGRLQADLPGWPAIAQEHRRWLDAISRYREALPVDVDEDSILRSLLHMHHNRAVGVGREREAACLRLARQAGASWRSRGAGT